MERFVATVFFALISTFAPAFGQGGPNVIQVSQATNHIFCAAGNSLNFSGHCSASDPLTESWLQVNHRPIAHRDLADTDDDDYSFTWSPSSAGDYDVRIGYYLVNSKEIIAQKLHVVVLDHPPVEISNLPSETVADLSATVTANTSDFVCSRAQLSINGTIVQDSKPPFTTNLVFKTVPAGTYVVGCVAFDASGATFTCPPKRVVVPERLHFAFPPSVTITHDGQSIGLSVQITNGVPVQSVTYMCDGHVIAESTKAPFATTANLSTYQTGSHKLSAQITLDDGSAFDSDPADTTLTNEPADQRIAAADAAAQAREAAAAEAAQQAREAALQKYSYIVQSPNLEVHATRKNDGPGKYLFEGTITNVGNETIPEVDLWCHLQGFNTAPKGSMENGLSQSSDVTNDPLVFEYVQADTYRNLNPGESRAINTVVTETNPLNIPAGRELYVFGSIGNSNDGALSLDDPSKIEIIAYVPNR